MGTTSSITITTYQNYSLSHIVQILLVTGLKWNSKGDSNALFFEVYDDPLNRGNPITLDDVAEGDPTDVDAVLHFLDEQVLKGLMVTIRLTEGDYEHDYTLWNEKPFQFTILLDRGFPRIPGTWLRDLSEVYARLLVPLVKAGLVIFHVELYQENN